MIINNLIKVNFFISQSPSTSSFIGYQEDYFCHFLADSDSLVLNFKNAFTDDRKNMYDYILAYYVFIARTKIQCINLYAIYIESIWPII